MKIYSESKNTIKKLAAILIITSGVSVAQAAPVYSYENTPAPGSIMNDYSTTWNPNTEALNIASSWDVNANIDRISFLITDGGSPYLTLTEQFLFYTLDLNTEVLTVRNYFGPKSTLQTFNNVATITPNSIDISIDHTFLNSLTFPGYSYSGAGFSNDIGIWYYMYSGNSLVETLDVHHAHPTSTVPVPAAAWLFGSGLLGLVGVARRKSV